MKVIFNIPLELAREFKAYCALQGLSMREVVVLLITEYLRGKKNP
jgi:hypothetical protein